MGLMRNLVDVYDALYASSNVNLPMIMSHSEQNAHIEILLNEEGKLLNAKLVDKEDQSTLIPVTIDSSTRTNAIEPHPLFDKLQYIAKDLVNHIRVDTITDKNKKDWITSNEKYFSQLNDWINYVELNEDNEKYYSSKEVLKRLLPLKTYLVGNDIISDLAIYGIIELDSDGYVKENPKDSFVRFKVHNASDDDRINYNKDVQKSFQKYFESKLADENICMITGELQKLTTKHPKRIRHPADGAKLISSNDSENFTFRGRFIDSNDALSIGYETSEKAHNALKWLIHNQSTREGETIFLSFSINNEKFPDPFGYVIFEDEDAKYDVTDKIFADMLNRAIKGYSEKLNPDSFIVALILDSATPGRLSIVFYRELLGSTFLQNIKQWSEKTSWELLMYDKDSKTTYYRFSNPLPIDIAKACYGSKISDKLLKSTLERLYKCIVDGDVIPRDLLETIKQRVSNYEGIGGFEWEKTLRIACAMFKNYYELREKEGYDLSLDRSIKDRSYLYGRLLAVADWIEQGVLLKDKESRATNALRYMNAFSNRPFKTWTTIKSAILPYEIKQNEYRDDYDREFEEIMSNFNINDFENDRPLSGKYLLGYYHQRNFFRKRLDERIAAKKLKENSTSDTEENNDN
ncbi:type I-C CRISPR-associated protein Cas8c/Csd1 [Tissierella creatinini]|nr:type I-C CRISPR-associated protein Cas8c/Csd1 [Tissierella creatinini]TJX64643.1 type I-C CRISPR-associated protein Cas8c/Csd1 [Soehngenia saccharolytica]